jgi:hypothetical protein
VAGAAGLLRATSFDATNGVVVGRLARNADPAGTADQTGNGRLNLDRALSDTSTDPVVPAGSPPVGGGGPYVGPYTAGSITSVAVTFPANSGNYNATTYAAGGGNINGTVAWSSNTTDSGRGVSVSIKRNSDNLYWNGSSFASATEVFNTATCSSCTGNGGKTWSYAFALPADGSYTVKARATQTGATSLDSSTNTFTVDTTSPGTASVTAPGDGNTYAASTVPATFSGSVADNSGGSGLNANSATFTLQRGSDNFYWTGSAWQLGVSNLATTHVATTGSTAAGWTDNATLPTWTSQPSGTYTVQAKATDKAGNAFTGTAVTFTLDATAPTVTIDSLTPNPTGDGTTVTWHANENGAYSVRVGGTTCATGTPVDSGAYTQPATVATGILGSSLAEGANTIRVCVTDAASNAGTATSSVTKDSTDPITASVTTPVNNATFRAATVPGGFSGSVADNTGGAGLAANSTSFTLQRGSDGFYWTGTTWQAGAFSLGTTHGATSGNTAVTWTSAATMPGWASEDDGSYTVRATATDKTGNSFSGTAISFTLDSTGPATASVTAPADGSLYRAATVPASFAGSVADNSAGAGLNANSTTFTLQRGSDNFYWTGSAWQSAVANLATTHVATTGGTAAGWTDNATLPTWSSQADGTYTVQAKATDKVGNTFTGAAVSFTLDKTLPVVTTDSATPNPTSGGTTITWHANENGSYSVRTGSSCTAGTVLASGSYSTQPSTVATVIAAASLSEGSNTLIVCVTDGAGNAGSTTTTVTKDTTDPVTASVTIPANNGLFRGTTVPAPFSGTVADNSGGAGLAANSTTFTLQRPNGDYWTGTTWQSGVFTLGTTHGATTGNTAVNWTNAAAMPSWATQDEGTYTIQATATDKVGNTFTGTASSFTLDDTAPATASVTTPADSALYNGSSAPTSYAGSAADNSGGGGLNANSTTFTLQRPNGDYWTGSAYTAAATALTTTHVATSGSAAASWSRNLGTTWESTDGTYTVRATATDKAGNTFSGSAITFTLDRTVPTLTVDSLSPNPTSGGTTVTWHANENGNYSVRTGSSCTAGTVLASGSYANQPNTVSTSIGAASLAEGSNTLVVCVTDATTNTGSATTTVTKDTTIPITASVTTPANNAVFRAATVPAGFSGSAADNSGGAGLAANSTTFTLQRPNGDYWTGTTWQSGVFTLGTTHSATSGSTSVTWTSAAAMPDWTAAADGTYTVRASATDKAGNGLNGTAVSFTLDNTRPTTASVTTPVDSATYQAAAVPATFAGSVADNAGGSGLNASSTTFTLQRASDGNYWNGSSWQASTANLGTAHAATTSGTAATWTDSVTLPTWSSQSAGTYTVQAKATDKAGNTFTGSSASFTLLAPSSPQSGGTGSDTTGSSTVQLTGVTAAVGRTMFLEIAANPTSSTVTVTDSAGNTYTKDIDVTNGAEARTLLFSARITTALAGGTITTSYSSPVPTDKAVSAFSFEGIATPSPKDKSSTATGNGTSLSTGTTATTSQPDELLLGAFGHGDGRATFDPGANYTALTSAGANGSGGAAIFPEYRLVSATGAYSASATNNNSKSAGWAAALVTYRIALPTVQSITRDDPDPTIAGSVDFDVTFSQPVVGVGASDFALATSGVTGASITNVTGSGTTWTVSVGTGSGSGTIGLNVADDDSITNLNLVALGGTGTGNGNFTGPFYTINRNIPTTTSVVSDTNPSTYGSSVNFTATVGTNPPGANGNVTFKSDGTAITGCSSVALNSSSQATCSTSALKAVGSPHSITAEYNGATAGGTTWSPSTSPALSQSVSQKALTVSGVTAANKTYDGNATASLNVSGAALVGVVSGDTVTLGTGSAAGAFANKNVGTGKTVQVSGLTISGADSGNYTLSQPTTSADITAKGLTVSGITAGTKVYDGNTSATLNVSGAALVGVVSGDTVTLGTGSAAGAFANKNVGSGKTVQVSGLTISGTDSGNYSLAQPTSTANLTA